MNKLLYVSKNPLFIVLPIVALMIVGWQQYTEAKSQINISQTNILPNAGLDDLDSNGFPIGWHLSSADSGVTATSISGYNSPKLLALTNSSDTPVANTTLTSPLTSVQGSSKYLYKGFYKSTVPFDLILRTNYKDGSNKHSIIGHYDVNSQWATVSHLFTPDSEAQTVQIMYSFASRGELQIDNNYLEPNPSEVYSNPQPSLSENLIPNTALASSDNVTPDGWTSFKSGDNKVSARYITSDRRPYISTEVNDYTDGETKWQYDPIGVHSGQAFQANVSYRSDIPVDVVAEFVLSSGERKFSILDTLLPAKDWTTYTSNLEVPSAATSLLFSVVSRGNGTLDTKEYGLYDTSKPGVDSWQKPLVSITFDDGWETAYSNGSPLLNKYGYKATFYINPSSVDTENYTFMRSDQIETLKKNGHELASHGFQHLDFTTLNKTSIDYQLEHSYQYFKQVQNQQAVDFATPFGGNDSQVEFYARKYYASHRGTESGINTRQNFNPYNLLVLYIDKDTPTTKVAESLAEAKANNGWLILLYHRIDTATTGKPVITPAQFRQQLDAIKASDLTVMTVAESLKEIRGQP